MQCSNEVFNKSFAYSHFALKQWLSEEINKIRNAGKYLMGTDIVRNEIRCKLIHGGKMREK